MPNSPAALTEEAVIGATKIWLERAVIGLNLCPFAKAVQIKNQIRYVVSAARTQEQLVDDLAQELAFVAAAKPAQIDTTVLIHPYVLTDFLDYNDFLDVADEVLEKLELDGTLQIASFHPQYQFAGSEPDDIDNYTNRSPYPILHILREDSIERVVDAFPDTVDIYANNIDTLRKLGHQGWQDLMQDGALINQANQANLTDSKS
ncbi:MAG: DUF1415 domain-containing protein [Pseudomonadota bacterium]